MTGVITRGNKIIRNNNLITRLIRLKRIRVFIKINIFR